MNEPDSVESLLIRIKNAKHFEFHWRPRWRYEQWKDPNHCFARLGILCEDAEEHILKKLTKEECYKVEDSIDPKCPGKKHFFKTKFDSSVVVEVTLFIKISSPETYIINVDSFHESDMPPSVLEEEAKKI